MRKIKNNLTEVIRATDIKDLLDYTNEKYRPYDPGLYLYNLMSKYSFEEKFSDEFIELVYTTLIAWNMNQRAAKLADFKIFMDSLFKHKETIGRLANFRIEENECDDIEVVVNNVIHLLFDNLTLVAENKPKLVTFSKTLHFFLPNLLMPIDRAYTLRFFYDNHNVAIDDDKQIQIYLDVFDQFRLFAKLHGNNVIFKEHDKRWNKNLPKMIDNIIIAFISNQ